MANLGMGKLEISSKHMAIVKANAQIVAVVGVAAFVTIFCVVASQAVWSQNEYQTRVTKSENVAHKQLLTNIKAYTNLVIAYNAFNSATTNVLGGSSSNSGANNDGTNTKLVLDALPSSYDFPALTSSIEKILDSGNFQIGGITGTDNQLAEQGNNSSANPQAVGMPFSFTVVNSNYTAIEQLITTLQESIRPIQIQQMTLTGGNSSMGLTVNAQTYYQPGKSLGITKQEVQ
jgi:hypothetical protein